MESGNANIAECIASDLSGEASAVDRSGVINKLNTGMLFCKIQASLALSPDLGMMSCVILFAQ